MAAELRNRETTVLHDAMPHQLHKVIIDEGQSPTALLIMNILTPFGELPTQATHHLLAHDVDRADDEFRSALCFETLSLLEPRNRRK